MSWLTEATFASRSITTSQAPARRRVHGSLMSVDAIKALRASSAVNAEISPRALTGGRTICRWFAPSP